MQEIHTTTTISGGGGGRVFGDRRMRPHSHQQMALKCPRCESPNTKFCYYNNYNLSQPRHFCKNCRRYWTKGGVLRNVPIGGGCRKSKRSSAAASKHKPSPSKKPLNSHSSSDSSTTTTSAAAAATAISGGEGNYGGSVGLEPLMEANEMADRDMLMSPEIGGFMSYMSNSGGGGGGGGGEGGAASSAAAYSEFLPSEVAVEGCWEMRRQEEEKMVESGMFDPTVRVDDLLQNRGSSGGLAALDWDAAADAAAEGGHGGLFDFSSAAVVDHHQSYWNQTTTSHAHHHQQHQHQHQHQHQWFDHNSNNGYSLFPDFLS